MKFNPDSVFSDTRKEKENKANMVNAFIAANGVDRIPTKKEKDNPIIGIKTTRKACIRSSRQGFANINWLAIEKVMYDQYFEKGINYLTI